MSGQVMVEMLASYAPSLHSLLSIITYRKNCCRDVRSRSVDTLECQSISYSLCSIIVRGCRGKISSPVVWVWGASSKKSLIARNIEVH